MTGEWTDLASSASDEDLRERILTGARETRLQRDRDPGTHQLRVLATVAFDAARAADDPRHFEVLLYSRVYRR